MIKQIVKSVLGEKNIKRIRRLKSSINAAKISWKNSKGYGTESDKIIFSCLMSIHMLEKALVMKNDKYLNAIKYNSIIENISKLLNSGISSEDFSVCESVAVLKSTLSNLSGHDDEKKQLENLIEKYKIPSKFKGGIEKISRSELLKYIPKNWSNFVKSRRSIRNFKDKIISKEIIYDIIRDAEYYPSACNRQPCKIYFSENKDTIKKIIMAGVDKFIAEGVHDCFIVTCDRALLSPAEINDQEFINGGIFLGYLVMSIHAHGLGACLCQFLQANQKQTAIKKQFGIKDSEVIVAFVAFGEMEDEIITACAQRREVETIAVNLDEKN